jgi:molybdopterin-dependent oxidoreductase alpha subunit
MRKVNSGGGWPAVMYTFSKAREAGGLWKLWKAMRSKNACKTCALGMGGQAGGMVNELGHFPEVCKKSLQAMVADMQAGIQPDFWSKYTIAQLQTLSPRELESCGRISQPVMHVRGEQHYRPIGWGEAYRRIAAKLKSVAPDETFWYFSGRSSNEAGFLLQLFARVYGTNNVNNCSFYCHQASGVGLNSSLGTSTATIRLEDLEHADLIFVIGGNPASNHPRLMTMLKQVRRRGGEVIVINPVIETGMVNFRVPSDVRSLLFGTKIASMYVQPHIGGDLALLSGIAKRIVEMRAHDEPFLQQHCTGWPEFSTHLENLSWDEIVTKSGVSRVEIDALAERYAQAKNVVFSWTMGITHHAHGVENVEEIANLAMLRGMVGRPHAGLLPIRGHSNVQGIGSMGVTPKLKDILFERLQNHFHVKLPTTSGLDTMACLEGAEAGRLKFAFCLGGNLYGSNPDAVYAGQAMSKLDTLVYLNTTLNTGHAHGLAAETIVLPVQARDEESQATTQESMFNYVRLSDGGPRRHANTKSEIEIISHLAHSVLGEGGPIDWKGMENTSRIREAIARIVPGFEQIADIDRTKQEFQIPGRTFHEPKFPTADGRAQLRIHQLPDLPCGNDSSNSRQLRLMTVRSEGQFNTVVYEEYDLYRGIDRRDVVLLHPDDVTRLGLEAEQLVTVRSDTGQLPNILVRPFEKIRAGNALMYYPEANVLVSRRLDPRSKTPAFKGIPVELLPQTARVGEVRETLVQLGVNGANGSAEHEPSHNKLKAC